MSLMSPPSSEWQVSALRVVLSCQRELWSGRHSEVVMWLLDRGLSHETLQYWLVGFNPEPRELYGLWVPAGVVIPHWHEGVGDLWGVKVVDTQRYQEDRYIDGGPGGVFGVDTLMDHHVAVVCSRELDAMLLNTRVGDLVATITLDNVPQGVEPFLPWLIRQRLLLIATDADQAGDESAEYWLKLTKRAQRLRPPVDPKDGKDVTDYWKAGGDLRAWVSRAL